MVTTMLIVSRELFEILLIIVPLVSYIKSTRAVGLKKIMIAGLSSGIALSIFTGYLVFTQASKFQGKTGDVFQGLMMIFLAALILYNITKVKKDDKGDRIISFKPITIFMIPFLTTFKELLEIIVFILPFIGKNNWSLLKGGLLGIGIVVILVVLIYKTTLKINISKMFLVITVMLILVGGDMIGEGLELLIGNISDSIKGLSMFLYCVPLLFILTKREINRYLNK